MIDPQTQGVRCLNLIDRRWNGTMGHTKHRGSENNKEAPLSQQTFRLS
jgi:hypothetical protein